MLAVHLPEAELIKTGLADLTARLVIIEALLVSIAAPGLCDVGLAVGHTIPDAEMQLYALLSAHDAAAAHAMHAHGLISAAVVRAVCAPGAAVVSVSGHGSPVVSARGRW